ncbi:MAG TPA: hypothetical protein VKE74_08145 [Gemmataceae bacterium]|nr:hypothetical protein [Gemmataceae bacterium]
MPPARAAGVTLVFAATTFWLAWALMPDAGTADPAHILAVVRSHRAWVRWSVVVQLVSSAAFVPAVVLARPASGRALLGACLVLIGAMGAGEADVAVGAHQVHRVPRETDRRATAFHPPRAAVPHASVADWITRMGTRSLVVCGSLSWARRSGRRAGEKGTRFVCAGVIGQAGPRRMNLHDCLSLFNDDVSSRTNS